MTCISFLSKSSDNLDASVVSQGHAPTALPWSYDLWYDPPKTQMKLNMTEFQTNSLASIMMGDISQSPIKVLFDSGATHNFIASSLVQHLKLQVPANPGFISCGGNATVSSLGYCIAPIHIGTYHEKVRFNVMPMSMTSFQVVLGQAWLATHDADINYLQSHISFWHQSKQHVLVFGSTTSDSACLSALEFRKLASEADSQIYVMIVSDPDSHASADTANSMAQPILKDYTDVFSETPPGIPPERGIGHTINTGTNSPIARPAYRMSPKEKDCAEEMVSQLI